MAVPEKNAQAKAQFDWLQERLRDPWFAGIAVGNGDFVPLTTLRQIKSGDELLRLLRPPLEPKYMSNYPDLSRVSKVDHLLFDIGYSTGLLMATELLLEELVQCDDYPVGVDTILAQIKEFNAKRLQLREEIYDNAEEAARKGAMSANETDAAH